MDLVYVVLGLVILLLAGDSLVRGAVNVSIRLGVPPLIVSLTIVAIGTSAPELLVAIDAVMQDAPGLAVGNVIGSNIANVLLVLGLPACLVGLDVASKDTKQSYMQMLAATALFTAFALATPITWINGIFLVSVFAGFMAYSVHTARQKTRAAKSIAESTECIEGVDPAMRWIKIAAFLAFGLIGLPLGAGLLVEGATEIARSFDISETVIGLTLVAIGTSLPELATVVTAAYRGHTEVAFGSVIGSNIANLLAIIGVASFFGDIPVSASILSFDIWVMVGASVLMMPFIFFGLKLSRVWGAVFTATYMGYILVVLI
ncbi:MAG: calcium/sodium antiporter [Paracoccaceae bacterium]